MFGGVKSTGLEKVLAESGFVCFPLVVRRGAVVMALSCERLKSNTKQNMTQDQEGGMGSLCNVNQNSETKHTPN